MVFSRMYKDGSPATYPLYCACTGRRSRRAELLSICEARWSFGDAPQELHGFYTEGEAFAVFALVDVEACKFADAVEAVADRVAVGVEVARRPYGRSVVAEVGDQGLNQLGPVAGVVVDHGLQGLAVEGFELFGVLLEHPEEEFVRAGRAEGRDAGGTVDAVADLQRYRGFGVGVGELGGPLFVAPYPDGDSKVG